MRVHWREGGGPNTWRVGIFQLGGDPIFRVLRLKGTWYVFPPTDPHGYARRPWESTGRDALGYASSREQVDRIVEAETTRWLNWVNDPLRAEQVAQIEAWYAGQGRTPPWRK